MSGDQLTFDSGAAAAARDEGMQRVSHATKPDWAEAAYEAVLQTALLLPDGFIVDDVWPHIDPEVGQPHEPRAMGPVMRRAQSAGEITPTDSYRLSARVTAHRNPRRVWVRP